MKIIGWTLGILFLLAALFGILQIAASERVEVVELTTQDEAGAEVITRLWIVDRAGKQYLRAGVESSGWLQRVKKNPAVKVTRNGQTALYQPIPRPELAEEINGLMQDKYTWGDTFIGRIFGRTGAIAIELAPAS